MCLDKSKLINPFKSSTNISKISSNALDVASDFEKMSLKESSKYQVIENKENNQHASQRDYDIINPFIRLSLKYHFRLHIFYI